MTFLINSKKFGKHAVEIDDEDWKKVKAFMWHVSYQRKKCVAVVTRWKNDDKVTTLSLHRFLTPCARMIDHKDGDPLNNKRSNLRACTRAENNRNRGKSINNVSGFKGVYLRKNKNRFCAQIRVNRQKIHLGYFSTKEDAAKEYNKAATRYFGKFARLNVI